MYRNILHLEFLQPGNPDVTAVILDGTGAIVNWTIDPVATAADRGDDGHDDQRNGEEFEEPLASMTAIASMRASLGEQLRAVQERVHRWCSQLEVWNDFQAGRYQTKAIHQTGYAPRRATPSQCSRA